MCAINPTHKKRFIIDCYTSVLMEDFDQRVMEILLENEILLNTEYPGFRFHLKDGNEKKDI